MYFSENKSQLNNVIDGFRKELSDKYHRNFKSQKFRELISRSFGFNSHAHLISEVSSEQFRFYFEDFETGFYQNLTSKLRNEPFGIPVDLETIEGMFEKALSENAQWDEEAATDSIIGASIHSS